MSATLAIEGLSTELSTAKAENRVGQFAIDEQFIQDTPDLVAEICSNLCIIRADVDVMQNQVMYWAYGPQFDQVPIGCNPDLYSVQVSVHSGTRYIYFSKDPSSGMIVEDTDGCAEWGMWA